MFKDIVTFGAIFLLIVFISWLSRNEIRKSRRRTVRSEKTLEAERNELEQRIADRTKALLTSERLRMQELERIAQFGQLSQGLFHDLINPLSSVSLYMERLEENNSASKEAKDIVNKAVDASKRMRTYMDSVKRCLGNAEIVSPTMTDISQEIMIARDVLAYKARMAGVRIVIEQAHSIKLKVHPVRVHQMLLNLISNGIDACSEQKNIDGIRDRSVTISAQRQNDHAVIEIRDNGCGFDNEQLKKAFKESFTTKSDGNGIGLTTIKSVVEDELHGSIHVESERKKGARFIISVPLAGIEPTSIP